MRLTLFICCVAILLASSGGNSFGGGKDLRVSAKDGLVSITSTESTLSEIIAQVSQELDMKINVHGGMNKTAVPCRVHNATIADALQKLLPEWDYMSFSRQKRTVNVWLKGSEDGVPHSDETIPDNAKIPASAPSSTDVNAEQIEDNTVPLEEETVVAMPDYSSAGDGGSPASGDEVVNDVPAYDQDGETPARVGKSSAPTKQSSSRRGWRPW